MAASCVSTTIQTPAAISATLYIIEPNPLCRGIPFWIVAEVSNTGQAGATGFAIAALTQHGVAGAGISGPYPPVPAVLPGGTVMRFTYTVTGSNAGNIWFSTTITASDANAGWLLKAGPKTTGNVNIKKGGLLSMRLDATKPLCVGQPVTVVLSITNTGDLLLRDVDSALGITQGMGLVSPVSSPPTTYINVLGSGNSKFFTWTYSAVNSGKVEFTATSAATTTCNNALISASNFASAFIENASILRAGLAMRPMLVCPGQPFLLTVTVTNTGAHTVTGVIPEGNPIAVPAGGANYQSGPSPPGPVSLGPGQPVTFSYTYTGGVLGPVAFSVTVNGSDAVCNMPITTGPVMSGTMMVGEPGYLISSASAPVLVSEGQSFTVAFTLTHAGDLAVTGITATIWMTGPGEAGLSSVPVPVYISSLSGGASTTFIWTGVAKQSGLVVFTMTASGTTCGGMTAVNTSAIAQTVIQEPPSLKGSISVSSTWMCHGETFLVMLTITNTGEATATDVTAEYEGNIFVVGGWSWNLDGPPLGFSLTLAGGESVILTWTGTASTYGYTWLATRIHGTDMNTGDPITSDLVYSRLIRFVWPGQLMLTGAVPPELSVGQAFPVSLAVSNTGDDVIRNTTAETGAGPAGIVSPSSGSSMVLPVLGSRTGTEFHWTFTAVSPGAVCFSFTVTGDTCANTPLEKVLTLCTAVLVPARLESGPLEVIPDPACMNQLLTIVMTVTNLGEAAAVNVEVSPDLAVEGLAVPVTSPTQISALPGGGSARFTWTYISRIPGTVMFTGTVTGADINTGAVTGTTWSSSAVPVDRPAELTGFASTLGLIRLGRTFAVSFTVSNSGSRPADPMYPGIIVNPGSGLVRLISGPDPSGPVGIAPDGSVEFTWTYSATGTGMVCFAPFAQGQTCGNLPVSATGLACSEIRRSPPVIVEPLDWPQFHRDAGRTGTTPSPVCEYLELKWTRTLTVKTSTRFTFGSPAVAGGRVYAGTMDGKLIALDAVTGNQVWSWDTGLSSVEHAPAVVRYVTGKTVVMVGTPRGMAGVDGDTGAKLWEVDLAGGIDRGSPVVVDADVYAVSRSGEAAAVDALTGDVIWRNSGIGPDTDVSPVYGSGSLFVLRNTGSDVEVVRLDAATGSRTGSLVVNGNAYSGPAYSQGRIMFGTRTGANSSKFTVIDAASMTLACSPAAGVDNPPVIFSTPAVDGGSVYVGAANVPIAGGGSGPGTNIGIWTAETADVCGTFRRLVAPDADVFSSPAVSAGERIFAGLDRIPKGDAEYAGYRPDGTDWFEFAVSDGVTARGSPAIARGMVYFTSVVTRGGNRGDEIMHAFGEVRAKPPFNLTAYVRSDGCEVTLCWEPPSTSSCPAVTGVVVFRRAADGGYPSEPIAGVPLGASCYTDTGLTLVMRYYYKVCTATAEGATDACTDGVVVVPMGRYIAPVPDPVVTVKVNQHVHCPLSMPPPPCPLSVSCTAYVVYRSTMPQGYLGRLRIDEWGTRVNGVFTDLTGFTDPGPLDPEQTYCYVPLCEEPFTSTVYLPGEYRAACVSPCQGVFGITVTGFGPCEAGQEPSVYLMWSGKGSCSVYVTGYEVYRSTYPGAPLGVPIASREPWIETCDPTGLYCFRDAGLIRDRTYYYRIAAIATAFVPNAVSSELAVTTARYFDSPYLKRLSQKPPPDGELFEVEWGYSSLVCEQPCTTYEIYRSSWPLVPGRKAGEVRYGVTVFIDPEAGTGTFYCYSVRCANRPLMKEEPDISVNGECGFSTGEPECPEGLTVLASGAGYCPAQVMLEWQTGTLCPESISGYAVYRATFSGAVGLAPIAERFPWSNTCILLPDMDKCYEDGAVDAGARYYYRIRAATTVPMAGDWSNEVVVDVPPYIPSHRLVLISEETCEPETVLRLNWEWSDIRCYQPVTRYDIFRTTWPVGLWAGTGEWLGNVGPENTVFVDGSCKTYCHNFAPSSEGDDPDDHPVVDVSISCGPEGPWPPCPKSLTVLVGGASSCPPKVKLVWAIRDSCDVPVSGYRIYRASYSGAPMGDPVCTQAPWATFCDPGHGPCYTDTGVSAGLTYYYRVCALTAEPAWGACSNEFAVTVWPYISAYELTAITQTQTGSQAVLDLSWEWSETRCGMPCTGYTIYRSSYPLAPWGIGWEELRYADASVSLFTGESTSLYCYSLHCVNNDEVNVRWDIPMLCGAGPGYPPECPEGLKVGLMGTGSCPAEATLTWWPVTNDCAWAVTGYRIFRATHPGVPVDGVPLGEEIPWDTHCPVGIASVPCYHDAAVSPGAVYYYRVCALTISPVGEACSNEVAVKVPAYIADYELVKIYQSDHIPNSVIWFTWSYSRNLCFQPCTTYQVFRTPYRGSPWPGRGELMQEVNPSVSLYVGASGTLYCYNFQCSQPIDYPPPSELIVEMLCPQQQPSEPPCPTGLTVMATGYADACPPPSVRLAWGVTGHSSCNPLISGYQIYRSDTPDLSAVPPFIDERPWTHYCGDPPYPCYTDYSVQNGRTYYYKVCASTTVYVAGSCSAVLPVNVPESPMCLVDDPYEWCNAKAGDNMVASYLPSTAINDLYGTTFVASGTVGGWVLSCAGVIVFGTLDGYVYMLNPDGTLKCSARVDGAVSHPPVIDHCGGHVWVATDPGYLYRFNTSCQSESGAPCAMNGGTRIDLGGALAGRITLTAGHKLLVPVARPVNRVCIMEIDNETCSMTEWHCGPGSANGTELAAPLQDCPTACGTIPSCTFYVVTGAGVCRRACDGALYECDAECVVVEQKLLDCGAVISLKSCGPGYELCGCRLPGTSWTRTYTGRPYFTVDKTKCAIYVGYDSVLEVLDCDTGETLETIPTGSPVVGDPVVVANGVLVPTKAGLMLLCPDGSCATLIVPYPLSATNFTSIAVSRVVYGRMVTTQIVAGYDRTVVIINLRPDPPRNLTVLPGSDGARLSWDPATPGSSPFPVAGYYIYRATAPGAFGIVPVNATPVAGTGFVDTAVTGGMLAYYLVVAVDAAGDTSPDSNIVSTYPPRPAVHFVIVAPSPVYSGGQFVMSVLAVDEGGNVVRDYTGTAALTVTDPGAVLPGSVVFTAANNGIASFPATFIAVGMTGITARDTVVPGISGSAVIAVDCPRTVGHLVLQAPAMAAPGVVFILTVTAYDKFGKLDTNFKGTVGFASSDPSAVLPGLYTFAKADAGVRSFNVVLFTPGDRAISANDAEAKCQFSGITTVDVIVPVVDPPTGLVAACEANGAVTLSWGVPGSTLPVSAYVINRSTDGVTFTPVDIVRSGSVTSYVDVIGGEYGTYFYRVQAVDAVGTVSAVSDMAGCVTGPPEGWPLAGYWIHRLGYNPYARPLAPVEIKWRSWPAPYSRGTSSLVCANRIVYGTIGAAWTGHDLDTGAELIHRLFLGGSGTFFDLFPEVAPAVLGTRIVFNAAEFDSTWWRPSLYGGLFAYDALDGGLIWANYRSSFDRSALNVAGWSNVAASGGRIWIAKSNAAVSGGNQLASFRLSDGSLEWMKGFGSSPGRGLAGGPAFGNGLVFAVFGDGKLVAADGATGSAQWTKGLGLDPEGRVMTPLVKDGRVYAGSGTSVLVLDAATGAGIGSVDLAGPGPARGVMAYTPVLDEYNRLYFFSGGSSGSGIPDILHAYDVTPVFAGGAAVPLWERDDLEASGISSATGFLVGVHGNNRFTEAGFGIVILDPATGAVIEHVEGIPECVGNDVVPGNLWQGVPIVEDKILVRGDNQTDRICMLAPGPGVMAPTGLTAIGGTWVILLGWSPPSAGSFPVGGYLVYRTTGPGPVNLGDGAYLGFLTATYFDDTADTGLVPGQEYRYVVRAVDENGNRSPASNSAVATDDVSVALEIPEDGSEVEGEVHVRGTAAGGRFAEYRVRVWPAGREDRAVEIARSDRPVVDGPLARWIPGPGAHGLYVVELEVTSRSGRVVRQRHTVRVGRSVYLTGMPRVLELNSMSEVSSALKIYGTRMSAGKKR